MDRFNCHGCGTSLHKDDVVWARTNGILSTTAHDSFPWCSECAPEEPGCVECFERSGSHAVTLCPLHESATELLKALKNEHEYAIETVPHHKNTCDVCALIAKAEA